MESMNMTLSAQAVKEYLDSIPEHQQTEEDLKNIKAWCHAHISQDNLHTRYDQEFDDEYEQCSHLIKTYLGFLVYCESAPSHLIGEIEGVGLNLIQLAAQEGYDRFLEALTVPEAIINQTTTASGASALAIAAAYGRRSAVQVLLTKGADVCQKNNNNELPSYNALILSMDPHENMHTREAIFKILVKDSPTAYTNKNKDRETVFHAMASQGYSDLLKASLQLHPQGVLCMDAFGHYPAHVALLNPHDHQAEMLMLLLQEGVANKPDFRGKIPLHYAAEYESSLAVAKVCIDQTAALDTRDHEGRTPLMLAVKIKNRPMIEALLDKKVDLTLKDANQKTSLDYANETHDNDFCEWFLSKTSSPSARLHK